MTNVSSRFTTGLRHGIPIAAGYFTVSIAFGLAAAAAGLPTLGLALMSATNLSSSGQFAGVAVIAGGSLFELAVTTMLVNLRYVLMSMSLSQRINPDTSFVGRLIIAYGVTDEIFALELNQRSIRASYAAGITLLPIVGWTSGTVVGALAGEILPESLLGPMGVLLYAMFTAVVVPAVRRSSSIAVVSILAGIVSAIVYYAPFTAGVQDGWRIIFATLVASTIGAIAYPEGPINVSAEVAAEGKDSHETEREVELEEEREEEKAQ